MNIDYYAASQKSVQSFMAFVVPPVTLLIVLGGVVAAVLYIRRRTGRPKKASVLSFFGGIFLINAVLLFTDDYTSTSWLSFFFLLAISVVLFAFGYHHSELRQQLRKEPASDPSDPETKPHGNHAI